MNIAWMPCAAQYEYQMQKEKRIRSMVISKDLLHSFRSRII